MSKFPGDLAKTSGNQSTRLSNRPRQPLLCSTAARLLRILCELFRLAYPPRLVPAAEVDGAVCVVGTGKLLCLDLEASY